MGITNPNFENFKGGLWGWVTNVWKKIVADSDGHLQVDVLTAPTPTGGATSANQTILAGHVDGIEGILRGTEQTIARAVISAATSPNNTLIAAAGSGVKNKVLGLILIASGDVDVRLESAAGGTALTGVISLAADGNGFVLPMAMPGHHWIETGDNALLNLELSAAVQVSGCIVYYQE